MICDGLYGEKENANRYKEGIVSYIFKRYQENQNKAEEFSDINNNYIPINYRKKIHNLEKIPIIRKYCKNCDLRATFYCKECDIPLHTECFNLWHNNHIYNKK